MMESVPSLPSRPTSACTNVESSMMRTIATPNRNARARTCDVCRVSNTMSPSIGRDEQSLPRGSLQQRDQHVGDQQDPEQQPVGVAANQPFLERIAARPETPAAVGIGHRPMLARRTRGVGDTRAPCERRCQAGSGRWRATGTRCVAGGARACGRWTMSGTADAASTIDATMLIQSWERAALNVSGSMSSRLPMYPITNGTHQSQTMPVELRRVASRRGSAAVRVSGARCRSPRARE